MVSLLHEHISHNVELTSLHLNEQLFVGIILFISLYRKDCRVVSIDAL